MYEVKTKPTKESVATFLNSLTDEQKILDSFQLVELMREVTNEEPILWGPSIIGFGKMPYLYENGRTEDWPIMGFSPRKQSLTIYPPAGWRDREDLLARLGKHKTSKSCLYINRLKQVDMAVLKEILVHSFSKVALS